MEAKLKPEFPVPLHQTSRFLSGALSTSQFLSFNQEVYLLSTDTQDLSLPSEYTRALEILCEILSDQIIKNENPYSSIDKSIQAFSYQLNHIIFKVCIDIDYVKNLILKSIEQMKISNTDLNIDILNKFLNDAQEIFEFKQIAKKIFIIQISLEDTKHRFIEKYMNEGLIDIEDFENDFEKTFSSFRTKEGELDFNSFYIGFQEAKENLKEKTKHDLGKQVLSYLLYLIQYSRIAVYATQITELGEIVCKESFDSIMITCLICQKSSVQISSCLSLSNEDILYIMKLNADSFLIHYNLSTGSQLLEIFSHENFQIIEGSSKESLFIYKEGPGRIEKFSLIEGQLIKLEEFYIKLYGFSFITNIEYVKSLSGFIYVLDKHEVCLRPMGSSSSSSLFISDDLIINIRFCKEGNYVFVKKLRSLDILNAFLVNVDSLEFESEKFLLYEHKRNRFALGFKKNIILHVNFSLDTVKDESSSLDIRTKMEKCKFTLKNFIKIDGCELIDFVLSKMAFHVPDSSDEWEQIKFSSIKPELNLFIRKIEI